MNPILGIGVFTGNHSKKSEEYSIGAAEAVLDGLAQANALAWRTWSLPRLYGGSVRYKREPRGRREHWQGIRAIFKQGHADCDDLAAARAGELIASGKDTGARVYIYRTGARTLHAVVRRSDGRIEDPSRILGMGRP